MCDVHVTGGGASGGGVSGSGVSGRVSASSGVNVGSDGRDDIYSGGFDVGDGDNGGVCCVLQNKFRFQCTLLSVYFQSIMI